MYNFFLTYFVICDIIFMSYGSCPDDLENSYHGIPSECSDCNEAFATPTNHICSISYLLFTPESTDSACYVEPENQNLDCCKFDSNEKTYFLINGYSIQLKPGNLFERMKDEILEVEDANVIIVNWTRYDNFQYNQSVEYAYTVGVEIGNFINYLMKEKRVDPAKVHIIGHSLGAHVAGAAGKQVSGLGRITGLDPAALSYSLSVTYNRLTDSDAIFVDVIHCSSGVTAKNDNIRQGIPSPIGDIDFYPNGGIYQPSCIIGKKFTTTDGVLKKMKNEDDTQTCRHDLCPIYFTNSIRACKYMSRKCSSYKKYNEGKCFSREHPKDLMGFHAVKIPGVSPHSKFYLNTTADPPFCSEN